MRKNVSEFEAKTMENKFSTLRAVERKSRLGVKIIWKIEARGENYKRHWYKLFEPPPSLPFH